MFSSLKSLVQRFHIVKVAEKSNPSFNICPSSSVAAIVRGPEGNRLGALQWGLIPSWSQEPSMGNKLINARSETVHEKPSFRESFQRRRCLIPANGFFEWQEGANSKIPMYIHLKSEELFAFAGLWDSWISPEKKKINTCTIITTEANQILKPIHHRMPVILKKEVEDTWIDPTRGAAESCGCRNYCTTTAYKN